MASYRRVFLLVLDGLGVGGAPDAAKFGDEGSDTLAHVVQGSGQQFPNLSALGLGNLYPGGLLGLPRIQAPRAHHCRLTELSPGKDSTSGHWEMMGIVRSQGAPTFPNGFPEKLIAELSARSGRPVIGNTVASGTAIIEELGQQQMELGALIVYTSADSVLQIAAHTDVVPLEELYHICSLARELMKDELGVDRVIARPFIGTSSEGFTRTYHRRDFALRPPGPSMLDELLAGGKEVISLGKVYELFAGAGFSAYAKPHGNHEMMLELQDYCSDPAWSGLLFANFGDFDTLFGHRNDAAGYAVALAQFDAWLADFLIDLEDTDLLLITGDHGNDPTTPSTDHSREQVPLLIYSQHTASGTGRLLEPEPGFFHIGATVLSAFGLQSSLPGINLTGEGE